ncbi:protoporphyrinogen oxidase [Streptomyces pactum]|uniref:Coproporphyrinogen III oxidase n=1 Tax=Streptomyces pactum TaxID=68249 RepID=A0ABS0NQL6_9ACTN|nr:protoporphyrinogen oxidase [Streptomyces pactum]MBH5337496.1 protoporphyrinogen oxidase [Streptomyces pactum]
MDLQRTSPAGGAGHVAVIGGGISGLAAAHRLLAGGARVTVLEASDRLGGKLMAGEIAGAPVDLGAESMLARRPEATDLARAVGLADRLRPPAVTGAGVWSRGGLRPMPAGHVMGVPDGPAALAASGVLSADGLARIAAEEELPATEVGDDVAIGEFVARRFGREVVDRLVEPLLGGVYAGDAYRISMRAAVPQLFAAVRAHASLTEAVRAVRREIACRAQDGPVFVGIDGGVGLLPDAVAGAVRAAGGEIRTGVPVRELRRTPAAPDGSGGGWRVVTGGGTLTVDAVVLAVPAPAAARLLAAEAPGASGELTGVEYASMALVTMAFRRSDAAGLPVGTGFLLPPVEGRRIKAVTFSGHKWGWVGEGDPDLFVLRTSVGRYGEESDLALDDEDLVALSRTDLAETVGLAARPVAARVTRWDAGLPQYPVGHLDRVARVREQVAKLPGLAVCGAVYDGVGIPACIGSGRAAAEELLATLPPGGAAGGRE